MKSMTSFLSDEDAAVTVDFVVLTAGGVGIAIVFMAPISAGIGNLALFIASQVDRYQAFLQ